MSRRNKVNKSNYVQEGRLTPDEMARERVKQTLVNSRTKEHVSAKARVGAQESSRPRSAPEE